VIVRPRLLNASSGRKRRQQESISVVSDGYSFGLISAGTPLG
jgi:hypothetical protein